MYFDSTTQFSNAQAVTTTAVATNLYDVTGAGSGVAPSMIGPGGVNTALGLDIGLGDGVAFPVVVITVTTAGTGAGNVAFQLESAPDNGSYSPGSYTIIYQSAAYTGSALLKGYQIYFQVPPNPPNIRTLPRFYQLNYAVSSTFTASFTANLLINGSTIINPQLYGNNFVSL